MNGRQTNFPNKAYNKSTVTRESMFKCKVMVPVIHSVNVNLNIKAAHTDK